MRLPAMLFSLIALVAAPAALALDYRSLTDNAIVYDASSAKSVPQFILLKGTPVELLTSITGWAKVREASGGIGWVERTALSEKRQVIVTANSAEVRQNPASDSALLFTASKDVVLELIEKPGGPWARVRHRDGRTGFIDIRSVWGL